MSNPHHASLEEELFIEAIGPPKLPLLKRINAGYENAIHCLVFEFLDDSRRGFCLSVDNEPLSLTDENIASRGGDWVDIRHGKHGDFIRCVKGANLKHPRFLCHNITIIFASGQEVSFHPPDQTLKGENFSFDIAETKLVTNLLFLSNGSLSAIGVVTTSMHLPIHLSSVHLLPEKCRKQLLVVLMCLSKMGTAEDDASSLPIEVRWRILSFLNGYQLVTKDHFLSAQNVHT